MLDLSHLPGNVSGTADVQTFTTPSTVTNIQWHTWTKPRGKSWALFTCYGGGAGGGGGFTRASGAGGGGGSGGSSGGSRLLAPLWAMPDTLYIQVGFGGPGSAAGTGTSGGFSYVAVAPNTAATNLFLISGNAAPTGGGTGTVSTSGGAGSAGTIATIGTCPLAGVGYFTAIAGQVGVTGAAASDTAGTAQIIPVSGCLTMAGSGGAGVSTTGAVGGVITAIASSLLSEQAPSGAAIGADGSSGFLLTKPWFSYGGLGGGSSNAGVGGNGGYGGPGSGGGGGGSGTTGGVGGNGGNGLVIIMSW